MAEKNDAKRKVILRICIAIIVILYVVYWVFRGGCAEEPTTIKDYLLTQFVPQLGNSMLVFTLLWWFGAPMLKKMVSDRKDTIEREIQESTRVKEKAEEVCADVEVKMSKLSSEVEKITTGYKEVTISDCDRIAKEAEHTAENLRKDAQVSFELQAGVAQRAFENEIMNKAIEKARDEISRKLSADSALRDRLIDQSIASLEI